ncbi:MAG: type II secretion system F family protein [Candidatus Diapherotrites archaeon]|nr:type II secretion system F family protein [Candidatus Diapherotrites archaeon]
MKLLPLCPMPVDKALKFARPFTGTARFLRRIFPSVEAHLQQARSELNVRQYMSLVVFSSLFYAVFLAGFFASLGLLLDNMKLMQVSIPMGMMLGLMVMAYQVYFPKILVEKRVREIEKGLMYGLRSMSVQVRSGVPLFNAINSISRGNYGELSKEFAVVVKEVNAGISMDEALDRISHGNPSIFFRRMLWQLSTSIKSGSDISNALLNIINSLTKEQMILIKDYGAKLNPMTLVYMMAAVIVPAIGLTFLIILASFPELMITEWVFGGFLGVIVVFQVMFLGLIKSSKPNLVG